MPKVLLLTYDVESREPRRKDFEGAGFTVAIEEPSGPASLEAARRFAPDVIAVDCGQLPSHCRETAEALRTNAATGGVPLVLFRVAEHDIERTRLKVPGGVVAFDYELLDRIRSAALTRLAYLAAQVPLPVEKPAPRPAPALAPAVAAAPAPSPPGNGARTAATPIRPAAPESRAVRSASREAAPVRKAPARAAARSAKAPVVKAAAKKAVPRKKR